jgi:hypothetical protein
MLYLYINNYLVPEGKHISDLDPFRTPGVFYTYFYNHDRRLRLEKLLYIEPSRSPTGFFKPLLGPDDGFTSETAERRSFRSKTAVTRRF